MFYLNQIYKKFNLESAEISALNNVSISIQKCESLAITGPSGSGKSTLLNIAGLIEVPDSGEVVYNGKNLNKLSNREKTDFRRINVGYIFQKFHLIPVLSSFENISLPALLQGQDMSTVSKKVKELLRSVGMFEYSNQQVKYLSGGQRQRVAIARALINNPKIILADEPTANLDGLSGKWVLDKLFSLTREHRAALMIVTHDEQVAKSCDRIIRLKDGKIHSENDS